MNYIVKAGKIREFHLQKRMEALRSVRLFQTPLLQVYIFYPISGFFPTWSAPRQRRPIEVRIGTEM